MTPPIITLIQSTPSTTFPALSPPLHTATSPPPPVQQLHLRRRDAVVLLSIFSLFPSINHPPNASALSFGISGPKDWLREQKKKASKFVLAPIDASRNSLQFAYSSLTNGKLEYTAKDLEDVQKLLKSAARDCIIEDRDSLVTFQANTGVEVCTFKLVVNNAASLLDDKDPVKLEAEAKLSNLVRSFTSLSGVANAADIQLASNRQKMADALMDTISSLNSFEQGIKDCLEI
ncbi:Plasma membrane fusion protein [Heracleum sosnowskyi]|uniref:Plasma membrane fusion protein n=1 Tax=Heracleum sosnowskyi TaxID=360622 RepID=A0AAD8J1K2_9APIA|nr:Plasma membrane fusion protein [Heracleum sosnowskyi]